MTENQSRKISSRSSLNPEQQVEIALEILSLDFEPKFDSIEKISNYFQVSEKCVNEIRKHVSENLITLFQDQEKPSKAKSKRPKLTINDFLKSSNSTTEPIEIQSSEKREPEQVLEAVIAWNDSGQGKKVYLSPRLLSEISTLRNDPEIKDFLQGHQQCLEKHYKQHEIKPTINRGPIPWDEIFENYDASQQKPDPKKE